MAHPKSAILLLIEHHPHPHPSPEKVRRLPSPLTSLYNPKNKGLDNAQLNNACQSTYDAMTITTEEADYLEHRKGRITASKFGQISHTNPTCPSVSLLKNVMQYIKSQTRRVPALKWGVDHEDIAREEYIKLLRQKHESFECHLVGLTVNPSCPHLGASPDGIVSCLCCGAGLLEIKCLYKHRDQHPHYISDAKFCLHRVAEAVQLKSTHDYYIQIQGQMAICKKDYCDFVCWTPKGVHVERIAFDASVFSRIKPSLDHYFQSVELLTHAVQDGNVEAEKNHVAAYSPSTYWRRRTWTNGCM